MFSCFHDAYTKEKSKGLKDNKYAEKWWDYMIQVENTKPDWADFLIPKDEFRKKIYNFVIHPAFDNFIMSIIISNLFSMAMSYETQSVVYGNILGYINLVFTGVFILEAGLKILAFGFTRYFQSSWNRFDFFVVLASLVDISVSYGSESNSQQFLKSLQIIRVLRVLRVTR